MDDREIVMAVPQVREVEDILSKIEGVKSEVILYPRAGHGFGIRADLTNEQNSKQAASAGSRGVSRIPMRTASFHSCIKLDRRNQIAK
jgi:hypothetical protein